MANLNGHGGARPGAGRKPTAEQFASEIAEAKKRIADRLPQLVDSLFELALGVTVEEVEDGKTVIFTKPPDRASASYLMDRILGKPTQAVEMSGPDGQPLGGIAAAFSDEELDNRLQELYARDLNERTGSQGDPRLTSDQEREAAPALPDVS